jgi:hypothetical protein
VESYDMRSGPLTKILSLATLLLVFTAARSAHASAALLVEEPYGFFGGVNPTGHSAIYLNRVCAASPIPLRRCTPGETGVVISRYSNIGHYDWIAIPLIPYLYAVERPEDVPVYANPATVDPLRHAYADAHLQELISIPAVAHSKTALPQLLGVSYIRKIYSFEISTTEEQDDRFIETYNDRANHSHFNLFTNNCADFARHFFNMYFPGAMNRGIVSDLGITTPKHIAKGLSSYARHHDDLEFSEFIIPQVPGSYPRSHKPQGVVESLCTSKKYAVPIAVLHPYFMVGIALTYITVGRFNVSNNSPVIAIVDQTQALLEGGPGTITADTITASTVTAGPITTPRAEIPLPAAGPAASTSTECGNACGDKKTMLTTVDAISSLM